MTHITIDSLKNKKIAILGFGLEGVSAARFLLKHDAVVTVFDEKAEREFYEHDIQEFQKLGVQFQFGRFPDFVDFHYIVRSPGIHLMRDEIKEAQEAGVIVTSPTKLFFDLAPTHHIIGVTGTKGKGTTSTLIYEMLKKHKFDAYIGGNIGTPVLDFLDTLTRDSWVVLELSSFQLQDLHRSPHIAVMLMVTSEHLDYHRDVYEYIEAKRNLLRFQHATDYAVLNWDYPATRESDIHTSAHIYGVSREQTVEQGCFVKDDKIYLKMSGNEKAIFDTQDVALMGKHNLENVCAAIVAATLAGADMNSIVPVVKTFKGLPHRLELINTVKGVRYYNDSFSTTPETAIAAIESFEDPKILILGGSSKGSDFAELGELISTDKSIKAIIGIGEEWSRIKSEIRGQKSEISVIEGEKTMKEIVQAASEIAELGDVVLLSPACASFGMFKNYKDRGEQFKREVDALKK